MNECKCLYVFVTDYKRYFNIIYIHYNYCGFIFYSDWIYLFYFKQSKFKVADVRETKSTLYLVFVLTKLNNGTRKSV